MEQQRIEIEQLVQELLSDDPASFLVEIKINAGNNIKVFIDHDKGTAIDQLVRLNRALYKKIEEAGIFPGGDFALEVSSPGLGEPLKLKRQYLKNVGREVEAILKDGRKLEGKLASVNENTITLEELKGKKKEVQLHTIDIDNIKHTKIQIKF